MKHFKMQGMAITGPIRYRTCFSPCELLRQRELAAGFFAQQCSMLSYTCRYHAEMFYQATFLKQAECTELELPLEYAFCDSVGSGLLTRRAKNEVSARLSQPEWRQFLEELWTVLQAVALPEPEKNRLFCLLAAGYGLAGQTLQTCPLTAREAEAAYLRLPEKPAAEPEDWLCFRPDGEIRLKAREAPYRIRLARGAEKRLEDGAVITPRKLVAEPHPLGVEGVPVTLELYSDVMGSDPQVVTVEPGDYRYLNFVEELPVWIHPVSARTAACAMERAGTHLSVTDSHGKRESYSCAGLEIIGFVPEETTKGWILLTDHGADLTAYSRRWNKGNNHSYL